MSSISYCSSVFSLIAYQRSRSAPLVEQGFLKLVRRGGGMPASLSTLRGGVGCTKTPAMFSGRLFGLLWHEEIRASFYEVVISLFPGLRSWWFDPPRHPSPSHRTYRGPLIRPPSRQTIGIAGSTLSTGSARAALGIRFGRYGDDAATDHGAELVSTGWIGH